MRHECDDCDFCTFSGGSLRAHRGNIDKNDEFECDICKMKFDRKTNLKRHHDLQHVEQSIFSKLESKNFLSNLDATFSCVECGKTFKRKDNLKRHRATHRQDRTQCELDGCSISFPSNFFQTSFEKDKLKDHIKLCLMKSPEQRRTKRRLSNNIG